MYIVERQLNAADVDLVKTSTTTLDSVSETLQHYHPQEPQQQLQLSNVSTELDFALPRSSHDEILELTAAAHTATGKKELFFTDDMLFFKETLRHN